MRKYFRLNVSFLVGFIIVFFIGIGLLLFATQTSESAAFNMYMQPGANGVGMETDMNILAQAYSPISTFLSVYTFGDDAASGGEFTRRD